MRRFNLSELASFKGLDGAPTYIAYEGRVFDVSSSWQWQRGRHQVVRPAGLDYTGGHGQAPYGADLLERVRVIGILVDES